MDVFEKKQEWGLKKMKWSSPNILIVKKQEKEKPNNLSYLKIARDNQDPSKEKKRKEKEQEVVLVQEEGEPRGRGAAGTGSANRR